MQSVDQPSIKRLLGLPEQSFFLFGPRGVGKSTWLRSMLPTVKNFNLLDSRLFLEFSREPANLEAKIGELPPHSWVCIDEIQRVPDLLNEVHRLIEERRWKFALSGSSARKLKRGGANLLGGRAITKNLEPFVSIELAERFDLQTAIEWGQLPLVVLNPQSSADTLSSYVHTYIKEEIREEGVVRKIEPFLRFLQVSGALNGMQINSANIAREAQIPRSNIETYFAILEDTLVAHWLPAYQPRIKLREQSHPKFYWFDPGVARAAAGLAYDPVDELWKGRALETLLFHELRVYNKARSKNRAICFYRTKSGTEIDFIIETQKATQTSKARIICIEVKYSKKWDRKWEGPIRSLAQSKELHVEKMLGVYLGSDHLVHNDFKIFPFTKFLHHLHQGNVF
jgi:uncharacterized protein